VYQEFAPGAASPDVREGLPQKLEDSSMVGGVFARPRLEVDPKIGLSFTKNCDGLLYRPAFAITLGSVSLPVYSKSTGQVEKTLNSCGFEGFIHLQAD
jgi:hypothetical protein